MKKVLSIGLIAAFAILLTSCEEAPEAKFSYEIDGKTVKFTNQTEGAKTYAWQFGDGATSEEEHPTHEYSTGGEYIVSLIAKNDKGVSEPANKNITIEGGDGATVALPSFPNADAICVAVNNSTFTNQGGFDIEVKLAAAVSVFYDQAGSFVNVGAVTVDSQELEKGDNNYYTYYAVGSKEFANPVKWSAAGGGDFPAVNRDVTLGFPAMKNITSGDVETTSDYNLTFAADITGADSMIVIISGANNAFQKTMAINSGSYTISQSDLANLGATENGIVSVSAYNYENEVYGDKTVYFVNQGNVTKTVRIE